MTKQEYILLRLIDSVGLINGRKRLQKTIFLLWHLGLPLEDRFSMHYYGPYSADLALQIDSLVNDSFLLEDRHMNEYTYVISERGQTAIAAIDEDKRDKLLKPIWIDTFKALSKRSVSDLEKAATILFWLDWGKNFNDAYQTTQHQKGRITESAKALALELANQTFAPLS